MLTGRGCNNRTEASVRRDRAKLGPLGMAGKEVSGGARPGSRRGGELAHLEAEQPFVEAPAQE